MIRGLAIILLALAVAGCSWFGKDEEIDPPAPLEDFKQTLKVRQVWKASSGDDAASLRLGLGLATDGTNIFAAGASGTVSAFEALKGKRAWRAKLDTPLAAGPAYGDGLVVVSSRDGDIIALDAADGSLKWKTRINAEVLSAPTVARNRVLLRAVDGTLRALDAETGIQSWFVEQNVPRLSVRGTGSPVVAGSSVLAGFDNGKFMAVSLTDGEIIWEMFLSQPSGRTELDRMVDVDGKFGVIGKDVYVSSVHGRTVSMAVESGQILWSRDIASYSGLGLDWDTVYVSAEDSHVVAISRDKGAVLWRQEALKRRILTAPVPYGTTVVVGDFEGYVHWLSAATGEFVARVDAGDAVQTAPIVLGDMIYVVTEDAILRAYRADFGTE